jgi:peptidoglycan/LPS O-acetylase OafA/YrhL
MWLGRLSYAIYLLHFSLLRLRHFVDRLAAKLLSSINADLLGILAFYVLLLLLASVCYRWIEQPGRRLIRGLERGLEDQAPPVVAEPASSFAGS